MQESNTEANSGASATGRTDSLENLASTSGFSSFTATLTDERYTHFRAIEADKQQRILRAALEEFAEQNYTVASTNAIVKRANISKGLLFHYFGDKAGLYRYLFSHIIAQLVNEALNFQLPTDGDVFEMMKAMVRAKLETTARYMTESDFLLRAMRDTLPPELHSLVKLSIDQAYGWQSLIISLLDGERLRPGLSYEQVTQVIQWVCEGLANEYLELAPENVNLDFWEKATERVGSYLDLLRDMFYQAPDASGTEKGEQHERA